jgi:integrase
MNATASLRVKNGIYQIVTSYTDDTGKKKQKSESTGLREKGNKRAAERMLVAHKAELEKLSAKTLDSASVLFLDAMEQWMNDIMTAQVREITLAHYKKVLKNHIKTYNPFIGLPLQKLTPSILQGYYVQKQKDGISHNTIRKHHANINKFLKYAISMDMITSNPASRVTLPPKQKSNVGKAYTAEQLQLLRSAFAGDPLESIIFLTTIYGLRRSEICGLKWSAVDFQQREILICSTAVTVGHNVIYLDDTKSEASKRVFPITDAVYEHLRGIINHQEKMKQLLGREYQNSDYVCGLDDGNPINPDYVSHHFARVLKKNGLPHIRFHDIRHSVATVLRSGGYDMKSIQGWMGHSDIAITANIYTHFKVNEMTEIGAMMEKVLTPR